MRLRVATVLLALSWTLLAIAVVALQHPLPECVTPGRLYFHDFGAYLTPLSLVFAVAALALSGLRRRPRARLVLVSMIPVVASPFVFIGTAVAYLADTC